MHPQAGRLGGGSSLLNPRSHEVWPLPPREGGRAHRGVFQGRRRQLALVSAHGEDLSGLQSRRNKYLRVAPFPDPAVPCRMHSQLPE